MRPTQEALDIAAVDLVGELLDQIGNAFQPRMHGEGAPEYLERVLLVAEDAHDLDDMVGRACRLAFKDSFAKAGQRVIVVAGVPLGTPGATNMLRIAFVGAEAARE